MPETSIIWIEDQLIDIQAFLDEFESKFTAGDKRYSFKHFFHIDEALFEFESPKKGLNIIISNVWDENREPSEYLPKLDQLTRVYPQSDILIVSEYVGNQIFSNVLKGNGQHTPELREMFNMFQNRNIYFQNFFSNVYNKSSQSSNPSEDMITAIDALLDKNQLKLRIESKLP